MSRLAAWGFPDKPLWSVACFFLGVACVFAGFARLPRHAMAFKDPYFAGRAALLLFLAAFSRGGWGFLFEFRLSLIFAIGLLWVYLSGTTLSAEKEDPDRTPLWAFAAVVLLVAAGAWLRFHNLMGVPNGLHMDEAGTSDNFERALTANIDIIRGQFDLLCSDRKSVV